MKKHIFRLIVAGITFLLGLAAVASLYLQLNPVAELKNFIFEPSSVCPNLRSFPGRSKKISDIKKDKSGYFPSDALNSYEPKDDLIGTWYGKSLEAMNEESLLKSANENTEIYRFFWLRAFHPPVFVRIEKSEKGVKLFSKELDSTGSAEPGSVLRSIEISLKDEDFCKFLNLIDDANFWQMTTPSNMGRDGASWVLEGVSENRYHIVDRWSPRDGDFREACIFLLKLSGRNVDELKSDLY